MEIKILKTKAEYTEAVAQVERLMERGDLGSDEVDVLELLAAAVERYEEENFPI